MSFNPTKCDVIRIAPCCRKIIDTKYSLHGHTLEVVDASKYLGVTITESLTWEKHIVNITCKANRTLGFLRRNLRECTPPVKKASYKAMVRPSLENAATVWDQHLQNHIKAIEQVQRRAARFTSSQTGTSKVVMREPGANTGYSRNQVLANSFPRTVSEWNLLPASTVSAPTMDAFSIGTI
ncbi:hypothetical protein MAR_013509 [Mya arenaria]|uniref:Uncharacterized protein n=1 Tax=Mya arenaria TaxID=6604 RepID=A0ABY7G015_MYAAR|nr:hypothetical protein MAR_013509 [Mya arenaria]